MSKYEPLTAFLRSRAGRGIKMSFAEIEAVIGQKLPEKSKAQRAWWSNNPSNNVMTRAWLEAGYRTQLVDVAGETLNFVPDAKTWQRAHHPAFGGLRGTTTIQPGVDLTEPADTDWGRVYENDYDPGNLVGSEAGRDGAFREETPAGFTTDEAAKHGEAASRSGKSRYRHPAFGALKSMITLLPDVDYTAPADPDWGKVYGD